MDEKDMFNLAAIMLGSGGLGAGIGLLANESFKNDAAALFIIVMTVGVAVFLVVFGVRSGTRRGRDEADAAERARLNNMEMLSGFYVDAVKSSLGLVESGLRSVQHRTRDPKEILKILADDLRTQGQRKTRSGRDVSRVFQEGTEEMARHLDSLAAVGEQQEPPPVLASAP